MHNVKDSKKISWHEITNLPSSELKKKYKIDDKQLEVSVRRHLDGANVSERQKLYKEVWLNKR